MYLFYTKKIAKSIEKLAPFSDHISYRYDLRVQSPYHHQNSETPWPCQRRYQFNDEAFEHYIIHSDINFYYFMSHVFGQLYKCVSFVPM